MRPAAVSSISRTNWPADHVSADAEPAGLPFSKPIDASPGGVPNGERGEVGRLPRLLGDEADAGGHVAHRLQARDRRAGHAAVDLVLAALAGQHRPQVAAARVVGGRRPRAAVAEAVAVAVAVVAEEAVAAVGAAADLRVHDRQRADDVRIVVGEQAEPRVLEEAGVDHRALVEHRAAVADAVADGCVRVAGLRQADEVATVAERAVGGQRPGLEVALELVGDAAPDGGGGAVAVAVGDLRRGQQAGDLGRDRRGREAALLLPALRAERRPVAGDEVRGRLDVVLVVRRGPSARPRAPSPAGRRTRRAGC